MSLSLQGSIVALVTPMQADGTIDDKNLEQLVGWHIEQGTNAIVAVGTTGESATLGVDEHIHVVERVVAKVAGRIPVIAGTGSNSTREAIEWSLLAKKVGADACLQVTPYYNKPTQEGLYQHFKAIADAVDMPHILYNVPGRTAVDLLNETVLRLADHDNIIGIKDATGDIVRGQALIAMVSDRLSVFSGDDCTASELILAGAKGNISVTANVKPAAISELCALALAGKASLAADLQQQLMPLHNAMFCESNPIPVKWALVEMGKITEGIRLPLTTLSTAQQPLVREALLVI